MVRLLKNKIFLFSVVLGLLLLGLYDLFSETFMMRRFRSTDDFVSPHTSSLNPQGLEKLRASGGSKIVFYELNWYLKDIKGPIYIVDLTGGKTKFFHDIPDFPFLYNKHESKFKYKLRRLLIMQSLSLDSIQFVGEQDMSQKYGYHYQDIKIGGKSVPDAPTLDKFLDFLKTIPQDAWLHIHCDKGKGRTTVMMTILDIIRNGRDVSLEDIVERQYRMGGVNLFDTEIWEKGTYNKNELVKRQEFLKEFYGYNRDPQGYGVVSWQEWCSQRNLDFRL